METNQSDATRYHHTLRPISVWAKFADFSLDGWSRKWSPSSRDSIKAILNKDLHLRENPSIFNTTNVAILTPCIPSIGTHDVRCEISSTSSIAFTHNGDWLLASTHVENRPRPQSPCTQVWVEAANMPRSSIMFPGFTWPCSCKQL
jgi:hypothetical protein